MRLLPLIIIGVFIVQTALAQSADADKIYNAKPIDLPNAMKVIVVENNRTPAVTHMVWYRVGGADEPLGQSGLAHFLEHLMFKGTDLIESGEFSKKVKSWGGNDNAFTSWDYTAYFQTVPKDRLEAVMIMEADRMRNLNFDDANALTERDVIIQERKERTDSNPSAQLSEAMRAALFVNHPYARPIIGWDHELEKLDPDAARDFYKHYYAPKNAILVVSGDVVAKDVFEKAMRIYGTIDNDGAITRDTWPDVPRVYGTSTITHSHPSVKQPIWRKLYRVPSGGQNYKDFLALTILEDIIGQNTGRLYQSLVVDQKLASATSFYYSGIAVDDSTLTIAATPLEGISSAQIGNAIQDVLNDIADNGVSVDDIKKSVSALQDESIYDRDSLTGPAMMIGYQIATGMSLDQIESWATDLEKVTPDDIQRVVKDYLIPSSAHYHAVKGYLVPEE
jgi:zinc protease